METCSPDPVQPEVRKCSVNLGRREDRRVMAASETTHKMATRSTMQKPSKIMQRRKSTVVQSVSQMPLKSAIRRHSTEVNSVIAAKKPRVKKTVLFTERGTTINKNNRPLRLFS